MKMAIFWVVAPYSPVEIARRFRGAYCFHHETIIPEDGHLNTCCRENRISHSITQLVKKLPAFREPEGS
jgi:hypothetical protein